MVRIGITRYDIAVPSKAINASPAVAHLLRERRQALKLTLRRVAALTEDGGNPIPHSTLARIERGKLDPGVRRLQQLLRLYNLPAQAAGDLLDLEALAGAVPFERDPRILKERAVSAWRDGRVSDALASFLAFRDRVGKEPSTRAMRQDAVLSFASAAASLGKQHLSRLLLDDLLLDKPEPAVLVALLLQQSIVWRGLGSTEAAIAFIERAAAHVAPGSHRHHGWIDHQRALIEIDLAEFATAKRHLDAARAAQRRADSPRDEAAVLLSYAHLAYDRGDAASAVAAAARAAAFADRHKFARLKMFGLLEQARALLRTGDVTGSRRILQSILADSLVSDDNVIRFHAHYYLWKAECAGGVPARADVELREAAYFVRFVDQMSPEASEVRTHLGPTERKLGRKP